MKLTKLQAYQIIEKYKERGGKFGVFFMSDIGIKTGIRFRAIKDFGIDNYYTTKQFAKAILAKYPEDFDEYFVHLWDQKSETILCGKSDRGQPWAYACLYPLGNPDAKLDFCPECVTTIEANPDHIPEVSKMVEEVKEQC
jgi:ribosomal protein S17E